MAGFDPHPNLATGVVAIAPSPPTTGINVTLQTGQGAFFSTLITGGAAANATIGPDQVEWTPLNTEIVRITNVAGDVLTFANTAGTRNQQEGSSVRSIQVGDRIRVTDTDKVFTDIELYLNQLAHKGSLIGATAANTPTEVMAGADGTTLIADSTQPSGLRFGTVSYLLSKMVVAGHSYNMSVQNVMAAGYSPNGFFANGGSLVDRGQWPHMVQDVLGIGADRKYLYVPMQATTVLQTLTYDVPVGEDCWVESAAYFPNASISAGAAATSRSWSIQVPDFPGATTYHTVGIRSTLSTDLGGGQLLLGENALCDVCEVEPFLLGSAANQAFRSTSASVTTFSQFTTGHTVVPGGSPLRIVSAPVGATGKVDPGGVMVIRLGGRVRNYSVGGSSIVQSGVYAGGWPTSMNPQWTPRGVLPQPSAPPVNLTAKLASTQTTGSGTVNTTPSTINVSSTADFPASGTFSLWNNSGTPVTVTYTGGGGGGSSFTGCTIASGSQTYNSGFQVCPTTLSFEADMYTLLGGFVIAPNGTTVSVPVLVSANSTSCTIQASSSAQGGDHGTVAVNTQMVSLSTAPPLGYETLTSPGLAILLSGINDCGSSTGFDIIALRETIRAWAALHSCSAFYGMNALTNAFGANIALSNGTGSWVTRLQPAWGQFGGGWLSFTGIPNASSKITISLGKSFAGGTVDLFFLAWQGTADGGTASITVDGATPPQGAVTVVTTGACPTSTQNTTSTTAVSGGASSFTATLGRDIVGRKCTGARFNNGTYITGTDGGSPASLTTNIATIAGTSTCTFLGAVPMVKRLTGLAAGAHTIEITITAMFSTAGDAEFAYLGYGIEPPSNSVGAPVLICNVPQILGTYFGYDPNPNAQTLNTEIPKIINGTATAVSGNTAEPALQSGVVMVDLDTVINKGAQYFSNDGLHPNTLGHAVIADAILKKIHAAVLQLQAVSR